MTDYDALVKALRDTDFSDGCPCMSACYCENDDCLIVQAANAIEELSKPRWISVKERLPVEKVWVLCACRANIFCVMKWDGIDWYENPTHIYMSGFVTHWTPLPEPPKEET